MTLRPISPSLVCPYSQFQFPGIASNYRRRGCYSRNSRTFPLHVFPDGFYADSQNISLSAHCFVYSQIFNSRSLQRKSTDWSRLLRSLFLLRMDCLDDASPYLRSIALSVLTKNCWIGLNKAQSSVKIKSPQLKRFIRCHMARTCNILSGEIRHSFVHRGALIFLILSLVIF